MSHDHDHSHEHEPPTPQALRTEAIESLLLEKGLIKPTAVDEVIALYSERVGPMSGAKIVAKAWRDPEFKVRLLADGTKAIEEFDLEGGQVEKLVVLENTPEQHNVVVCTLCSCYPWAVLGLPPKWYKDPAYRSRIVREPRKLLAEMGTDIPPSVSIRVWDSSAEVRYMVLPMPPAAVAGKIDGMAEADLTALISRDAMIGVAQL
ncbi:MAG: nitrile hydratase [Candidatus Azotimanducaceae bacterium]|jgi:nitrile hydratase